MKWKDEDMNEADEKIREPGRYLAEVKGLQATSEEHLLERTSNADALIVYHFVKITARVIEQLNSCRVIVRGGVGYDNIDVGIATELGIPVSNTPGVLTDTTADLTWALLLSVSRNIVTGDE